MSAIVPKAARPDVEPAPGVDLGELFRDSKVGEVLEGLDRDLVGLLPVKQRIREIAAFLLVSKARERQGCFYACMAAANHNCFKISH